MLSLLATPCPVSDNQLCIVIAKANATDSEALIPNSLPNEAGVTHQDLQKELLKSLSFLPKSLYGRHSVFFQYSSRPKTTANALFILLKVIRL